MLFVRVFCAQRAHSHVVQHVNEIPVAKLSIRPPPSPSGQAGGITDPTAIKQIHNLHRLQIFESSF